MAAPRPNSPTDWRVMSAPSAKRYQRSVADVAPVDCTTIGVVQPRAPPSVRVTFGRYARLPSPLAPMKPIAAPLTSVVSSTANVPPATTSEYSPIASAGFCSGSKSHVAPGLIAVGAVTETGPPPPRRWNASVGRASDVPAFWIRTPLG